MGNCCCAKTPELVLEDIGRVLADRCMADNRYPVDVAREWLVLNPYAGAHFLLSTLIDATDKILVEDED